MMNESYIYESRDRRNTMLYSTPKLIYFMEKKIDTYHTYINCKIHFDEMAYFLSSIALFESVFILYRVAVPRPRNVSDKIGIS